MGSEWRELRLKDVVGFVADNRGKNPDSYAEEGIPVIDNYLITSDWLVNLNHVRRFIDEDTCQNFIRKHIQKDDVLVTLVGNGYGQVGVTPDAPCVIIQNTIGLRCDEENDNKFLYYLLKANRPALMNLNIGAAQPSIKVGNLLDLEFSFPSLIEQRGIASVLESLDNKIALNRQINTTLESMAQALFKSWFVDFDPVIDNALAAGNEIPDELAARAARREALHQQTNETTNKTTGATDTASSEQALPETGLSDQRLPPEIQQLFPDRFVFTEEMGWVPEGWEVVDVEHILKRLKVKKRYKKGDVSSSGRTPVYEQGADILLGFNEEEAEIEASVNDPAFIFGDHTCVTRLSTIPFSISENVIALKPSKYDGYWTYHAYRDKQQFEEYRRHWMELIVRPVVVPTPQLASTFGSAVRGYYERSELVMRENTSLEDLRDSLLPKLLSGQITIPDAEQQLAEVL